MQGGRACPRLERGAANHSELPLAVSLSAPVGRSIVARSFPRSENAKIFIVYSAAGEGLAVVWHYRLIGSDRVSYKMWPFWTVWRIAFNSASVWACPVYSSRLVQRCFLSSC